MTYDHVQVYPHTMMAQKRSYETIVSKLKKVVGRKLETGETRIKYMRIRISGLFYERLIFIDFSKYK